MPASREDLSARRNVVPQAAGQSPWHAATRQSLWRAAVWTGAGSAVLAAVIAIVAVAVCWLPASGGSGSAGSVIRAGLLTFLAGLHGGITVGGVHTMFVPAGMTIVLGVFAWRAGCGLADAAAALDEDRAGTLLGALALQMIAFTAVCTVAAACASLGTSSVSPFAALLAALILFGACAGVALVRWSPLGAQLGDRLTARLPAAGPLAGPAARTAAAALLVYAVASTLLVAVALVVHHSQVMALSGVVGGGWSAIPVLVLGLLAAPNALVAGSAYLTGPGFAVGSGTSVSLVSTTHGTLPAFPLLGALPTGHGAAWPAWLLVGLTCLCVGGYAARGARRFGAEHGRWRVLGGACVVSALAGVVLAWLGGGAVGSGRLSAVGASPWQFGLALGVEVGVFGAVALAVGDLLGALRRRAATDDDGPVLALVAAAVQAAGEQAKTDDQANTDRQATTGPGKDKLAG